MTVSSRRKLESLSQPRRYSDKRRAFCPQYPAEPYRVSGIFRDVSPQMPSDAPPPRLSVKGYVTSTFFPVCAQAVPTDRSGFEPTDVSLRNSPRSVRGKRAGKMENRENWSRSRSIPALGEPRTSLLRCPGKAATLRLDAARSDGPRAVHNEGRARPARRGANSP